MRGRIWETSVGRPSSKSFFVCSHPVSSAAFLKSRFLMFWPKFNPFHRFGVSWITYKDCDTNGTRSREVDSTRRYTDLILDYRPSSDSACKGTKHVPALTSVKSPADESPHNNSSARIWNSLYYNGSYLSYYRTHQTSPFSLHMNIPISPLLRAWQGTT